MNLSKKIYALSVSEYLRFPLTPWVKFYAQLLTAQNKNKNFTRAKVQGRRERQKNNSIILFLSFPCVSASLRDNILFFLILKDFLHLKKFFVKVRVTFQKNTGKNMALKKFFKELFQATAGLAILFATVMALITAFVYFGNKQDRSGGVQVAPVKSSERDKDTRRSLIICDPVVIPKSDFHLIPIAVAELEEKKSIMGYSSRKPTNCVFSQYGRSGKIQNVLIRNVATGEQSLFLKGPALISQLKYAKHGSKEKPNFVPQGKLYWEMRTSDTNEDGMINGKDALVCYFSDLNGTNLRPLLPEKSTILSKVHDSSKALLLIRVRMDSNGDHEFTSVDDMEILQVNLHDPQVGEPVLSPEIRASLQEILVPGVK